jgi:hypothetical protein
VDRPQLGIIKDVCSPQLLRRAELPTVHAEFLDLRCRGGDSRKLTDIDLFGDQPP